MITIRDVARRARVSVGTVSNVMAGSATVRPELKKRVDDAMKELDYHPNPIARSLKTKQTQTLGTVISDITNPFFPQVVRGAEDAASAAGYLLITLNTDDHLDREQRALATLRARKVDGILLVVAPGDEVGHIESVMKAGIPVVCLDRVPRGAEVDSVCVDNALGMRMCVNHLLARGRKRIGFLGGTRELSTGRERMKAFLETLRSRGVEADAELVREGDFRDESGYRLAKELMLSNRPPEAIVASNALMGVGALKAMQELGVRCPEDVALAVFDEMPLAEVLKPKLTVVAQPAYEMGKRGAELLLARIEGLETRPVPVRMELAPELIVRESTT
jgi:LacI family transcriptional regulator